MKEAFSYMFNDNKFWQKSLAYLAVSIIAIFANLYYKNISPYENQNLFEYFLFWLIGSLSTLLASGYFYNCVKALIEQKENFILPFFNIKTCFITGIKYAISNLLLFLCIFISMFLVGLTSYLVSLVNPILAILILTIFMIILMIILICILLLCPALIWIFSVKGWYSSFLRFRKAFLIVKESGTRYWQFLGIQVLLILCITTMCLLLLFTLEINNLSPLAYNIIFVLTIALITSYTIFVSAFLNAKAIKTECIDLL